MDTFNPLDHPICFQAPDRINVPSAWYEHVPFAFYLTEISQPKCLVELGTHNGVSFLAFCQAIQSLSLDTKSYAIDTWEGDEMAGYYGQEVYDELRAYHDSRYAKFSNLLRMTFDEGVDYFSDGSIDLLHIDGLHTYEAVKHDFENWYKKLTPDGIVIFHDTNVRENDFGVWRYWEELKQKYTSFEFFHGHGLGVLTLADNFPLGLRVDKNGVILNKFRNFFSVLGQKHLFENSLINAKRELEIPLRKIEVIRNTNSINESQIEALKNSIAFEKANAEQAVQKLEMDLAAQLSYTKDNQQALIKAEEDNRNLNALIDHLQNRLNKNKLRFQEINAHWNALVNSRTWKTLNRLGKFTNFPDLTTDIHHKSDNKRLIANAEGSTSGLQPVSSLYASTEPTFTEERISLSEKYDFYLQPLSGIKVSNEDKKGVKLIRQGGSEALSEKLYNRTSENYELWIKLYDTLNDEDRKKIQLEITNYSYKPLISIIMPTYNTVEKWLLVAIESVKNQLYEHWELCIADDFSSDERVRKLIEEYATKDKRIKYIFRQENGHISAASNSALSIASGEFVALFDHDDLLAETALYRVAQALNKNLSYDLFYSDEDKVDEDGRRYDPYFKPDWNPELFLGQNYLNHLMVFRKTLLGKSGDFRLGYEGSQDWDLFMRIIESTTPSRINHIPHVLYHWRAISGSTALSANQKDYITYAQSKTLNSYLDRAGIKGKLEETKEGYWRIRLNQPSPEPKVSILIPTKDKVELLRQCIDSIYDLSTYKNFEILVIDNNSIQENSINYFDKLVSSKKAKVITYNQGFNYSAINNFAVNHAAGQFLLLLNNDIEVITPDWLEEMMSLAIKPETGAVGAKLYYPDGRIQHAGVILGIGGVAGHAYRFLGHAHTGQMGRAMLRQNLSAVTGACMMVEKKKYLEVGGLDEKYFKVAFNDIDFCLKLLKAGYRNVWTPHAELYHHESASRGYEDTPEKKHRFKNEALYMLDKWQPILQNDPAYNRNLSLDSQNFSLAFPPRGLSDTTKGYTGAIRQRS